MCLPCCVLYYVGRVNKLFWFWKHMDEIKKKNEKRTWQELRRIMFGELRAIMKLIDSLVKGFVIWTWTEEAADVMLALPYWYKKLRCDIEMITILKSKILFPWAATRFQMWDYVLPQKREDHFMRMYLENRHMYSNPHVAIVHLDLML